ncbi:MAG: AAA family ATPase [candidate division WOR-3 bacterium]|nr:AAA family ATPase [candidate division WOR-3 bacterium]
MDYLDEVVGQERAKRFIRNALKKGYIYNLLLTGPRGVGKRMTAFALAKILGSPPGSSNCILIAPVPPLDKEERMYEYIKKYLPGNPVVNIEDNSKITIAQIRKLIEWLLLMPPKDKKRVVIVLEADRMNEEAANAFLKTLEEPPVDTVFILTSSRPEYLIPTIRSRCRIVKFGYLSGEEIENITFGEDSFHLGSPGEIFSLKENSLFEAAKEIFKKTPFSMKYAAKFAKEYKNENLTSLFYCLLLLYRSVLYKHLNLPVDRELEKEITKKAGRASVEKIFAATLLLNDCINLLQYNPNPTILLFNTFLNLP